ncbi:MAG: hypothetical protein IKN50_04975, partial [Clostridia bacterium]|nr:hypothetical protein [Clostridia bacterium]
RWKNLDAKYSGSSSTENYIKYGAISAVRRDCNGEIEEYYPPVFCTSMTAASFEQQVFNVDGDYTIYAFFATTKDGVTQRHIISWSFKVRSYVYLLDKTTSFQIKNSGVSGNTIIIDSANRQGVTVNITGAQQRFLNEVDLAEKPELTDSGTYKFIVENRGFICEVFFFTIDKETVDRKVFFNNLKRFVGERDVGGQKIYTYEAEGYFSFEWEETEGNPVLSAQCTYWDYYDETDAEQFEYAEGTVLDRIGTYKIYVAFSTQTVTYYVNVIPMDSPSSNREKLSAARFNTFKTKWWEVTDTLNDRVLCFDYDTEYDRAYEAAMTIANMSVIEGTGRFFFNGNWYNDRVDLTTAMNEYVFSENLRVVYYDPADYSDDDDSLRTFSAQAFESTLYLDDKFQFVSAHPSEVAQVEAVDLNGHRYTLQFSVPMNEQAFSDYGTIGLPDGEYQIMETDKYGNRTAYTAYRDKSAPEVRIRTEQGQVLLENGGRYEADTFSVDSVADLFDGYAVLKLESVAGTTYFYREEYKGITYHSSGEYVLTAYDRNGNSISASVVIE